MKAKIGADAGRGAKQEGKPVRAEAEKGTAIKHSKPVGAIPELDVFDYSSARIDARAFNDARRKLTDYVGIRYYRVSHIVEFDEEFDFSEEHPKMATLPSTATEADKKLAGERYTKAWIEFDKRTETYNQDKIKFFGVMWAQCTTAMRHKLMEDDDYDTWSRAKDPLSLWLCIKRLSLEDRGASNQNAFRRIEEATTAFGRIRQYAGEKIGDFYDRFLTEVDAAEACGVDFINNAQASSIKTKVEELRKRRKKREMIEAGTLVATDPLPNLTTEEAREVHEEAIRLAKDQQLAMTFLSKLDKKRYGAMLEEWDNRLNDGDDVYPKTLVDAFRRVSNRKMDPRNMVAAQGVAFVAQAKGEALKGPQGKAPGFSGSGVKKAAKPTSSDDECWFCHKTGHRRYECEEFKKAYKAMSEKKKDDETVVLTMGSDALDDEYELGFCMMSDETDESTTTVFYSKEVQKQSTHLDPFDILCDNQATVSVFHQAALVRKVRKATRPINLSGIGGSIRVDEVADFGNFGEVYFHPRALANILCFHDLAQKYHVSYDSKKGNRFLVQTDKKLVVFYPKGKLYVYNPRCTGNDRSELALVQTVERNKLPYTKREIAKAEEVRDLYIKMARPAMKDFERLVSQGHILNCPVTIADVRRAEAIFGKDLGDLGALKGRTVRFSPSPVRIEAVQPSDAPVPVVVAMDVCFIEGIPFLVAISRGLKLITVQNLPSREHDSIMPAIRRIQSLYKQYGYRIDSILSDNEGAIASMGLALGDLGIKLNLASKGEHVAEAERAIRQIKERVRGFVNTLPFPMDEMLMVHLVYYCVSAINMIPREGHSESPKQMFTGVKADFSKDFRLQFGSYVQVHENEAVTNTMQARTSGAIALGPSGNAQGSYKFLSLSTWKVIVRRSWSELPFPNEVLQLITDKVSGTSATAEKPVSEDAKKVENDAQFTGVPRRKSVLNPSRSDLEEMDSGDDDSSVSSESDSGSDQHQALLVESDQFIALATLETHCAFNTLSVKQGIKEYGDLAHQSIKEEFTQLLEKGVFKPVKYVDLTPGQKARVLRSLMFLKKKRDGRLKSRLVVDGRRQAFFGTGMDVSSPTVSAESVFVTLAIDAAEGREVVVADIEGAYLAADMEEEVHIELDEVLTVIVLLLMPEWKDFVGTNGRLVLLLLKALYGCIQSARLFFNLLSKVLLSIGFTSNPYDPCVFNKMIDGKQCTVAVYVDDLKISCVDAAVVDDTLEQLQSHFRKITVKRGKHLDYLGMELDFSISGKVGIDMSKMVQSIIDEMPEVDKNAATPAANHLFKVDPNGIGLHKTKKEKFHSMVAKLLYLSKRGRPDILTAVSFLTTRVLCADEDDWKKLERVIAYLKGTTYLMLVLEADDLTEIHAYVDAAHAVHPDAKGQTGLVITLGRGAVLCKSNKQKLVAKSSTVAELIGLSDAVDYVLWIRQFMQHQGYGMKSAVIHQDNKSTIFLAENGKAINQRTRHIDIRYFSVKDSIARKEIRIEFTGTKEMIADFFTKPLQGMLFTSFLIRLLNFAV